MSPSDVRRIPNDEAAGPRDGGRRPPDPRGDAARASRDLLWVVLGLAAGVAVAFATLPVVVPAMVSALTGTQPRVWWYLARASGIVAYALLASSMVLGLLLSTRFAKDWPGSAAAFALHEHASLLGLGFSIFHALVLLGDRHTPFTLLELALPFAASVHPLAIGLGQLALYGTALLVASFHVRRHIGQRTWRLLHFGSFAVFLLVPAHAVLAGTDRGPMLVLALPTAIALFFGFYRLLSSRLGVRPARVAP